jgi:hypothetical protein
MAFSGDLEHLSIVDVIQLLHTSRKTGTLKVKGRKGEILLAFGDGYLMGASHYEQGARIGNILVETGVVSTEAIQQALAIQQTAGSNRKPLIATLLENNLADRNAAYRGLETLIELAIVEILTWKKGTFALHPDELLVCDEFRYFPDKLHEDISLPTEHVLMDALRIFDEKMRDGLLQMEEEEPAVSPGATPEQSSPAAALSADDLGLGDLDTITRKKPAFHEALRDEATAALQQTQQINEAVRAAVARLQQSTSLPEASLILLETVSVLFPRALTLVVWDKELVAERSIGITAPRESGPGPVMGFRIPLASAYLFSFVLDKGLLFYGRSEDQALVQHLYPVIGKPLEPKVLLLPLKLGRRVVAMIYADSGDKPANDVPTVQLERCAEAAAQAIERSVQRSTPQ